MKSISDVVYKVYKNFQHISIVVTIVQYLYQNIFPLLGLKEKSYKYKAYKEMPLKIEKKVKENLKQVKIAIICDEMTFRGFKEECECVFITPSNWMSVFREVKPDLFFCESTWHGISENYDCWRGKIYKSGKAKFENRKELIHILDFCQRSNIPTVFWNKEDPTYFGDTEYDFVNTALMFDYIYTTAEECVDRYKELGHTRVGTLMFGFSPKLFNPIKQKPKKEQVIFAGSWYQDKKERCQDMKRIFDAVLQSGLSLKIYDRHSESANPIHKFPDEYKAYIHKAVSFKELNRVLEEAQYAININTVKESTTMFARRVFEIMASNIILISNDSIGMRKLFKNRVWFVNEDFDIHRIDEIKRENLQDVFLNHTCKKRLMQIIKEIGIITDEIVPKLFVIYNSNEIQNLEHFKKITYEFKEGVISKEGKLYRMQDETQIAEELIRAEDFIIYIQELSDLSDIEFRMTQFSYLNKEDGISHVGELYSFYQNDYNYDVLFKGHMLKKLQYNMKIITNKIVI